MATGTRTNGGVLVVGAVYLGLAVAGVVTVGWGEFGPERPVRALGVFGVSTLTNILHAVLGVLLVAAALRRAVFAFAPVALVLFTALSVFGIVARTFRAGGDLLNLSWWNVALYVVSAVACGLVYAVGARPGTADRTAGTGT